MIETNTLMTPEEKKRAYQRAYYLKNREAQSARKKARREGDPALRARQSALQRARLAREKWRRGRVDVLTITLSDGREVVSNMLTLKSLAEFLCVKLSRLYTWISRGVVPCSTFTLVNGRVAYTEDQAVVIRDVTWPIRESRIGDDAIHDIHSRWAVLDNGIHPDEKISKSKPAGSDI